MLSNLQHVFFDLDGTVLDSAPGLCTILNSIRSERGLAPVDCAQIIPYVSNGISSILSAGFTNDILEREHDHLYQRFDEIYQRDCCQSAQVFAGIEQLLNDIENHKLSWSIITNKKESNSVRIIEHLGLNKRVSYVLGGDTLGRCKPYPDQLLHVCQSLNIKAHNTVMIGDSINDIAAAQACGAVSVLALWGYLPSQSVWQSWAAEHTADTPASVASLLTQAP